MSKLIIKILSADCNKCNTLFKRIQKIVAEYQLDVLVEKITDTQSIIEMNVYTIPALIMNNQIVSKGCLLSEKQIIEKINLFLPDHEKIPSDNKSKNKTKKQLFVLCLIIGVAFIAFLFTNYNKSSSTRNTDQKQTSSMTLADSIHMKYDYSNQSTTFELSFLEFGSTGCRECKMMEEVVIEVTTNFKNRIHVVFYNVTNKENRAISKYFGIQMIPVQILLDKNGKEIYRHTGFLSYKELCKEFEKSGIY